MFNSQNFHNFFFFEYSIARMKRNSLIHNTKFSENWPLHLGLQNVTYMALRKNVPKSNETNAVNTIKTYFSR